MPAHPYRSLVQAFRAAAARYSDRPAIRPTPSQAGGALDYRGLDRASDAAGALLAARGAAVGARVGLLGPNGAAFVTAYLGILKAGAAVVPLNLLISEEEMAFVLDDSGACGLLYHPAFAERARALAGRLPGLAFRLPLDEAPDGTWAAGAEVQSGSGSDVEPAAALEIVSDPAEDLAAILYTSGTTGRPKGAMLTHGNLLANTAAVEAAMHWRPGEETCLVVLPMFHAFAATVGLLTPLLCGCAIAPLARFEPEQVARTIRDTGATIFLGVPSMYAVLLRLPPEQTGWLGSLKFCISGGAALPVEVLRRFEARFGRPVYEGDGPTECGPVTCVNPIGGLAKPGTVGLPIPGVAMRIVGDVGVDPLPPGVVGEIAVRGPGVMKGYWRQPEATAAVFREGWFLTGDLGTVDEDGYFSIVDRKKDLIIVNGMNVYPRMIEEVLYRLPQVKEAAVVGEPHRTHGEVPVAYVALDLAHDRPGALDESAIRAHCKAHLGGFQVPRRVHLRAELPKNASGKLLKRELRRSGEVERGVWAEEGDSSANERQ